MKFKLLQRKLQQRNDPETIQAVKLEQSVLTPVYVSMYMC